MGAKLTQFNVAAWFKGIFKLTYFGAIQRIFLKTSAVVNMKSYHRSSNYINYYWADGWDAR